MRLSHAMVFLLSICFASAASADARIESGPNGYNDKGDNFYHVPYDNNNTDNESYISNGNIAVVISDGGATADARGMHKQALPKEMWPEGLAEAGVLKTSGDESGTDCTIEANGTTYTTNRWAAKTKVKSGGIRFEINCFDAAAVAE